MSEGSGQTALISAIMILVGVSHPVAAAPVCDEAARAATVRLIAGHPTANKEQTVTREEMDHIADQIGASSAVREAHPLMLSVAEAGTLVELDHRTIVDPDSGGRRYVCDVPTSVVVVVGAFKSRLVLDRNAAAAPCVREALLEHHNQHSRALDAEIDRFVDEHRDGLARDLRDLMRQTEPEKEAATQALEAGIASLVGGLYREFEFAIERSRQKVDSRPNSLNSEMRVMDSYVSWSGKSPCPVIRLRDHLGCLPSICSARASYR
jgi:hypothetical protein